MYVLHFNAEVQCDAAAIRDSRKELDVFNVMCKYFMWIKVHKNTRFVNALEFQRFQKRIPYLCDAIVMWCHCYVMPLLCDAIVMWCHCYVMPLLCDAIVMWCHCYVMPLLCDAIVMWCHCYICHPLYVNGGVLYFM